MDREAEDTRDTPQITELGRDSQYGRRMHQKDVADPVSGVIYDETEKNRQDGCATNGHEASQRNIETGYIRKEVHSQVKYCFGELVTPSTLDVYDRSSSL